MSDLHRVGSALGAVTILLALIGAAGAGAEELRPVWRLDLSETPQAAHSQIPFPTPLIVANDFPGSGEPFPLPSIILSRLFSPGNFSIMTFNSIQFLHRDGSLAGPPSRPMPAWMVGSTVSAAPCLALPDGTPNGSRFVVARADESLAETGDSREFARVDYYPGAGIAVGTTELSTRIHVMKTRSDRRISRYCALGAENPECGFVALALSDPSRSLWASTVQRWEILVLDRSGRRVFGRRIGEMLPDAMALQGSFLILSFRSNATPLDVALPLNGGTRILMPVLPRGLRTFSADGTHLLITDYRSIPDVLHYYDITDPAYPIMLWSRVLFEESQLVSNQAVSTTGRLVAWQSQDGHVLNTRLAVSTSEGIEIGELHHSDPYGVDGIRFLDDRYLLEGVYRDGLSETRTARLYDLDSRR